MMQRSEPEHAPPQLVVTEERTPDSPSRCDQAVVNRRRDVVFEKRSIQRRGVMPGARAEDIRLHRIRKRRREGELVVLKFSVELMERATAQS